MIKWQIRLYIQKTKNKKRIMLTTLFLLILILDIYL